MAERSNKHDTVASEGAYLRSLRVRSKRAANRRAQAHNTVHLLLTLIQEHTALTKLLAASGVTEESVLPWITAPKREHEQALNLVLERASRLETSPSYQKSMHVLLALLRSPQSDACRCLASLVEDPIKLQSQILALHDKGEPQLSEALCSASIANESSSRTGKTVEPSLPAKPKRPQHSHSQIRSITASRKTVAPRKIGNTPTIARSRNLKKAVPQKVQGAANNDSTFLQEVRKAEQSNIGFELPEKQYPLLRKYGRNLNQRALDGHVDPLIGRQRELDSILDVLGKRRSNNPLLVGPPGVGKTALVEGVARHLALETQPSGTQPLGTQGGALRAPNICDIRVIVELSVGELLSGTGMRGALSGRIQALIKEVSQEPGRIVLFIDEIHVLLSASDGPEDIANQLKSALARGELPCIGATTEEEFRKHFERDSAFARRFTRVDVEEPSEEEAQEILSGLMPRYALHHGVLIEEEAIHAAVQLGARFLPEQKLPEKALSALDTAGARARRQGQERVDFSAVAKVISEMSRVPLERMLFGQSNSLTKLEEELRNRIVGQEYVTSSLARTLAARMCKPQLGRPLGVFLLLGSTGVGKTETAKTLAELLFPDGAMTRIDMSTLSESHAVARLFGAPPGYIGHESGGQLTEPVRRKPFQLILLDEVEKAHPEVWLSMLPVFDEGKVRDGRGLSIDFSHTLICMTSNLGVGAKRTKTVGFQNESISPDPKNAEPILEAARAALPPELFNRFDEVLVYKPLSVEALHTLTKRYVQALNKELELECNVKLKIGKKELTFLASIDAQEHSLGARPLKRRIERLLEAPLTKLLADKSEYAGRSIKVTLSKSTLLISVEDAIPATA